MGRGTCIRARVCRDSWGFPSYRGMRLVSLLGAIMYFDGQRRTLESVCFFFFFVGSRFVIVYTIDTFQMHIIDTLPRARVLRVNAGIFIMK